MAPAPPNRSGEASKAPPPHPATIQRQKWTFGKQPQRPPHPATILQPKAGIGHASVTQPHPATVPRHTSQAALAPRPTLAQRHGSASRMAPHPAKVMYPPAPAHAAKALQRKKAPPTVQMAAEAHLRGTISAAGEDTRTISYGAGKTVEIDLGDFDVAVLRPGDQVVFELDSDGEVSDVTIAPQRVERVRDDQRAASSMAHYRRIVPISVQQQGDDNTCWAAVTASIAEFWAPDTTWTQDRLVARVGDVAETQESVSTALGLTGNLLRERDEPLELDTIRLCIDAGCPIIAGLLGDPGHVVIICGYKGHEEEVCIADPSHGGEHCWISYRHFVLGGWVYGPFMRPPGPWTKSWITSGPQSAQQDDEDVDQSLTELALGEEAMQLIEEAGANTATAIATLQGDVPTDDMKTD